MSTKTTLFFFFSFLNKSKYLREWISLKDLSKSRRGMKTLCFPHIFFKKKFPVFVHYFTLLSLNLHLKQLSCFEQIWIGYRLPRDIVKETMKGYKLEETIAKERKKEKDWGKNEACYNMVGSSLKFVCFRLWGPMQKGRGKNGNKDPTNPICIGCLQFLFFEQLF